ncbi:sensor histidine kinase [Marinobacterium rhizophilum]|uniref:sensor histidine kinase n=1 Tax=Marinobacterium rhizophilum TaxID=420402 RepID=UPI000382009D|nr:ATP-binding protein [Marinobacterium rhizophilum]
MMLRYLRQSMPGRVIGLLILALGIVNATTVYIFFEERSRAVRQSQMEDLVSRSAAMERLLGETPVALHQQMLNSVTSNRFRFAIEVDAAASLAELTAPDHPLYQRLTSLSKTTPGEARLFISPRYYWCYSWVQNLLRPNLLFDPAGGGLPLATVSLQRPDGLWLNAVLLSPTNLPSWIGPLLVALALFALTVIVVVLIVRHVTAPLAALTQAADRIGRGETTEAIAEQGPEDVRHTMRAFNRMRERLERFVRNRTQMMAAISHDLRTPLTSLRLHAEFLPSGPERDKMLCILGEMQGMIDATLAFTREDSVQEDSRTVDLAALTGSLCDDLQALGLAISYDDSQRIPFLCRPGSLRRALSNLIENACHYGGSAEVEIRQDTHQLQILVRDSGPGIAPADLERVFDPFVRLESSRNRDTGGIGLGLAIARSIAHAHGGEIHLRNRSAGGLEVELQLPRS